MVNECSFSEIHCSPALRSSLSPCYDDQQQLSEGFGQLSLAINLACCPKAKQQQCQHRICALFGPQSNFPTCSKITSRAQSAAYAYAWHENTSMNNSRGEVGSRLHSFDAWKGVPLDNAHFADRRVCLISSCVLSSPGTL